MSIIRSHIVDGESIYLRWAFKIEYPAHVYKHIQMPQNHEIFSRLFGQFEDVS